jgi:hypothetical protein
MKGNMGQGLKKYFALIDTNKDGGVDRRELEAAQKLMPRRRGSSNASAQGGAGTPPTRSGFLIGRAPDYMHLPRRVAGRWPAPVQFNGRTLWPATASPYSPP